MMNNMGHTICLILILILIIGFHNAAIADSSMRRVITSENEDGAAFIYLDDRTPHVIRTGSFAMGELWANDELKIQPVKDDGAKGKTGSSPVAGQTLMRYVILPPEKEMAELMKHANSKNSTEIKSESSGMHQTNTIDYGFILEGEVTLDLGKEKVLLKKGDSFVQNGTRHAWRNHSDNPAIIGVIMVGASRE